MNLTLDQAMSRGIAAHKEGRLQEAEKFYKAIIRVQPEHPDANHNLGVLAIGVGQIEASLPYFKVALEANRDQSQFWLSYIDALVTLGRLDDAREVIELGKDSGLQNGIVDQLKARLVGSGITLPVPNRSTEPDKKQIERVVSLYTEGSLEEALIQGKALAERFPHNSVIHNILGIICFRLGQAEAGVIHYDKSITIKPDDPIVHNNLGIALKELGRHEEAIASYRRAIDLNPNYAEVYSNYGNVFSDLGQKEEAIYSYHKAIELKPDYVDGYYNLGNYFSGRGNYHEAISCFSKVITLNPVLCEAHNNLGVALGNLSQYEDAIISYRKAIGLKADYIEAYFNLGNGLKNINEYRKSISFHKMALVLNPSYVNSLKELGSIFQQVGSHEQAISYFDRVQKITPDDFDSYNLRMVSLAHHVPQWHIPMMNDIPRNNAYKKALEATIGRSTQVLEIGTGSGLLSMLAAKCGTKKEIVTCEMVPIVARTAKEIITENGYSESIKVVAKSSKQIEVGHDLPFKADLIVSEILSNEFLAEGVLDSIEDARSRLLAPNGIFIPSQGSILLNLMGGDAFSKEFFVQKMFGLDLSKFNNITSRKSYFVGANSFHKKDKLVFLSDDVEAFKFDFNKSTQFPRETKILDISVKKSGVCSGIIQWIHLCLFNDITFENHPKQGGEYPSGWQPTLYLFEAPLNLKKGQVVRVSAEHNRQNPMFKLVSVEDL